MQHFTDRHGGVSTDQYASLNLALHVGDNPEKVEKNRSSIAATCGPLQYMNQVHGNRVAIIEAITDEVPTADALVTGIPGIGLAVMVADCIPLLLRSPEVVAAVHVGRRGLQNEVAVHTVSVMREMGASEISAEIGPAICGKCYEVSEEIFREVVESHPAAAAYTRRETTALDLPKALTVVLEGQSIKVENLDICTLESSQHFSYRRDGQTGRQIGAISL
jgi:YfiH family protein